MPSTSEIIHNIYEERSKFVVIGLTGRTGSGCSTTSNILTQKIDKINFPKPATANFLHNEERKYKIAYTYLQKNWQEFYKISVTDIITAFILKNNLELFAGFLNTNINTHNSNQFDIKGFIKEIETDYDKYFKERKEIQKKEENLEKLSLRNLEKTDFADITNVLDFYSKELPSFTNKLRTALDNYNSKGSYIEVYQLVGQNIRSSGNAIKKEFNFKSIFSIAKQINLLIKFIGAKIKRDPVLSEELASEHATDEDSRNSSALIVIDAIRNPFEASFFKDRYSAFYLVSINTPDNVRIERLQAKNLTQKQILELDAKEYPSKLEGHHKFTSQNIQKCIEIADIHLNNPKQGNHDTSTLKSQLVHYLALIIHPGLVTPTPLERCMQIAYGSKLNSACISRQVGAVITDQNYSIKAVGWNNTPEGQVPCLLRSAEDLITYDDKKAFSDYENNDPKFQKLMQAQFSKNNDTDKLLNLNGRNLSFCFKDAKNALDNEKNQVHTRSLHAEENAFLQLTKYGSEGIKGGILFTTASPCELCAKKAYQVGITKVVYIDPYPGIANNHILGSGKLKPQLELFHGAIGRAYHQLYQPILPFKDELEMLININYKETVKELNSLNFENLIKGVQDIINKIFLNEGNEDNKDAVQELKQLAKDLSNSEVKNFLNQKNIKSCQLFMN